MRSVYYWIFFIFQWKTVIRNESLVKNQKNISKFHWHSHTSSLSFEIKAKLIPKTTCHIKNFIKRIYMELCGLIDNRRTNTLFIILVWRYMCHVDDGLLFVGIFIQSFFFDERYIAGCSFWTPLNTLSLIYINVTANDETVHLVKNFKGNQYKGQNDCYKNFQYSVIDMNASPFKRCTALMPI